MIDKSGWTRVRFGEVVRLNKDRVADPVAAGIERYVGIEHIEPEDLRIRKWGLVAEGTTFTNYFRSGQVLFVKRRAYQRKVALADFEGVCSGDIYVLESKDPKVLLPELLPFICQTDAFFEHAVRTSAGSLSPRTNWKQLADYEFALPPLVEQRRIASVLINNEILLESLKELLDSLTALTEAAVEHFLTSSDTFPKIPLENLAEISYGLTVNRMRREAPNRIPYLRVANVLRGRLNLSEIKDIGFLSNDEQYLLHNKDVLIVEGHANREEIGRAAFWNSEIPQCAHQNHLIRVRCSKRLDSEFLVIYLNSTFGRRYFLAHAKSTSGLNTINSTVVREIPIPDLPLDRQKYIVDTLMDISVRKDEIRKRSEAGLMLKRFFLAELENDE